MRFGINKHKSRGFNYRPFYYDEEEERRERIFGEVHQKHSGERVDFKGKFKKKARRKNERLNARMIRLVIVLLFLSIAFAYIYYKDLNISNSFTDFFNG